MTHVHLVGLGGTGLSAIAKVLLETGYSVSGSDMTDSAALRSLEKAGARIMIGHKAENISGADLIIRSSAVPTSNPELIAARLADIPVYKRSEFLPKLLGGKTVVAVAGTHGKTTTTAMITWVLAKLGYDPSYIIGSVSRNLGTNANAGEGSQFVIEADEYDGMFLGIHADVAIVTTIEHDHPDCYPTMQSYLLAFEKFISQISVDGTLITSMDSEASAMLAFQSNRQVVTFGESKNSDFRYFDALPGSEGGYDFVVQYEGEFLPVKLAVPGMHNVFNATAALAACHTLGVNLKDAISALAEFNGTARRFEIAGQYKGALLVDDYAHHPSEIKATIQAARSAYPERRIWVVWQPHTYSRTSTLLSDYAQSFDAADQLIISDIYSARETDDGQTLQQLKAALAGEKVRYIAELTDIADTLAAELQPEDLLLVLSAGTAIQVNQMLLAKAAGKEVSHGR